MAEGKADSANLNGQMEDMVQARAVFRCVRLSRSSVMADVECDVTVFWQAIQRKAGGAMCSLASTIEAVTEADASDVATNGQLEAIAGSCFG